MWWVSSALGLATRSYPSELAVGWLCLHKGKIEHTPMQFLFLQASPSPTGILAPGKNSIRYAEREGRGREGRVERERERELPVVILAL